MTYYRVAGKTYVNMCDIHDRIGTLARQIMNLDDVPDAAWEAANEIESLVGVAMTMGQQMEKALREVTE